MGDFLEKVPHTPQKLPNKKNRYPWKEARTTRFLFLCREGEFSFAVRAVQILVSAPLAYRLLRSLALRKVSERWRRNKNARHKAITRRARARSPHKTATYCTSLGEKPPHKTATYCTSLREKPPHKTATYCTSLGESRHTKRLRTAPHLGKSRRTKRLRTAPRLGKSRHTKRLRTAPCLGKKPPPCASREGAIDCGTKSGRRSRSCACLF